MKIDEFEQTFVEGIMENSDGSQKRIGDFIIKIDYGGDVYYVGSGGDVVIPEIVGDASLWHTFSKAKNMRSLEFPSCTERFHADESKPPYFGSRRTLERLVFREGLKVIHGNGCFN